MFSVVIANTPGPYQGERRLLHAPTDIRLAITYIYLSGVVSHRLHFIKTNTAKNCASNTCTLSSQGHEIMPLINDRFLNKVASLNFARERFDKAET